MAKYNLNLRDDQAEIDRELEADTIADAVEQVQEEADDWVSEGMWSFRNERHLRLA